MASKTFRLVQRLLKKLSLKRRKSLLTLLPIAIITGLIDLLVLGLVSRVFTVVVGQENKPSIPFSDTITSDPLTKAILLISAYVILNWIASFSRISFASGYIVLNFMHLNGILFLPILC